MYDNNIILYELEHLKDKIDKLEVIHLNNELLLVIKLKRENIKCSYCSSSILRIHDYQKIKITHSILINRKVYIVFHRRRFICKNCMKYNYEKDPFTDGEFRVSTATLIGVLEYLKDSNQSFSGAAQRYNIGQNVLIKIFDKYVKPKRLKLPRVLSIDEVHIKSKTKYPYACVLLDFERNKIVDVLKTRHKDYLIKYFSKFSVKELDSVEYVTMDLWDTYKAVIKRFMPKAKIIADPFHVVTNINRILDKKRIQVTNYYLNVNKKDLNYSNDFGYLLKTYRNLITINPDKFYAKYIWIQKYKIKVYSIDLLKHLLTSNKELEEIYNLRNIYQRFNADTTDINAANIELKKLIKTFINHEISEIRKYGNLLNLWEN